MQKSRVAVLGATGMVGQRLLILLENHPYFDVVKLAASPRSAGKKYADLMENRWKLDQPIPEYTKELVVEDLYKIDEVSKDIDMVFCAINLDKEALVKLEEDYAKHEVVVVSNNSANRNKEDVPMIIPEINSAHLDVIPSQRERLGTKKGLLLLNLTALFKVMYLYLKQLKNMVLRKHLFVLTKLSQEVVKHSTNGQKW